MFQAKYNDPRAGFRVTVFPTATNVTFPYGDYEISLAADGQETRVYSGNSVLAEFSGTGADAVRDAVNWIEAQY